MEDAMQQRLDFPSAVAVRLIGVPVAQSLPMHRNFSWVFAGNGIYAACQWAMLVALTKLGRPEMVGQFALGLAITTPLIAFASLNLNIVQATDARREYRFGDYLGLRLLALAVALMVLPGVVLLTGRFDQTGFIILAVGVAKTLESVSDVIFGMLQQHERMDRVGSSLVLKGFLQLLMFCGTLYATQSVLYAVVSLVVVNAAMMACYDRPNARFILRGSGGGGAAPRWRPTTLRTLTLLVLPIGVVGVLDALNVNIPRYFVEHFSGKAGLGYFSALAYIMVAGQTVIGAMADATRPRLARYFLDDLLAFRRLLTKLLVLGAVIGSAVVTGAVFFGRSVLTRLYSPDYATYLPVFCWLMVAAALWYLAGFVYTGLVAARSFRVQLLVFGTSTASTALACILLVPNFRLLGASWAMCVGMAIRLLVGGGVLLVVMRRRTQAALLEWV